MYESAHLISSKTMTEITEFPMEKSVATYPSHRDVGAYFKAYADQFKLHEHYQYKARVINITKLAESHWQITWQHMETNTEHIFDAAGVLIASGTLHYPNTPEIPGNYAGEVIHAADYRYPESFQGQRVLIVGCGNSACDIAVDAVHHAKEVGLSVRRGYYFFPKFVFGKPIDTFGGKLKLTSRLKQWIDGLIVKALVGKPSKYGLPDPDYRLYESHPVMNSLVLHYLGHGDIQPRSGIAHTDGLKVIFTDSSEAQYDKIVFATGYKLQYPFIESSLLNWHGAAPDLYLNVFNPKEPNICMLGMIEATGLGWQGRVEQAELVALYLKAKDSSAGVSPLLAQAIHFNNQTFSGGIRYLKLDRMAYYVNKDLYRATVAKHSRELKQHLGMS